MKNRNRLATLVLLTFLALLALATISLPLMAQTNAPPAAVSPLPDASFLQPIIDSLCGKYGWLVSVISVLGTLRLVFKPAMTVVEGVVKSTGSASANTELNNFESGAVYNWLVWGLDFVASIKPPSAITTNPLVPTAAPPATAAPAPSTPASN